MAHEDIVIVTEGLSVGTATRIAQALESEFGTVEFVPDYHRASKPTMVIRVETEAVLEVPDNVTPLKRRRRT